MLEMHAAASVINLWPLHGKVQLPQRKRDVILKLETYMMTIAMTQK